MNTCVGFVLQRQSIGTASIQYAHWFLKEMSEEVNQVITAICEEQCMLADKVFCSVCMHYFILYICIVIDC